MRVGVAGLGAIGGTLAGLLGAPGSDPAVAGTPSVAELAAECDLVIVAVPPSQTAAVAQEALAAGALVADAASVKRPIAAAIDDPRFLPAHPMAGPRDLQGAPWAVCRDAPEALEALSTALGDAVPLLACTPEEHDAAVARTSHVPHIVAAALAAMAADPLRAALSGGALRDMTGRADADPALWAEIFDANRDEVQAAGEELVATLGARGTRAQIDAIRWQPREYEPGEGSWDDLLELGRRGAYVRKLRVQGSGYSFEHANMRSCPPKEDPTPASGAP
jgi:prephenate dehydrogenase